MFTDKQVFIFAITFVVTYFVIFRILTGRHGYIWITAKQYREAWEYTEHLEKLNAEYKQALFGRENAPTLTKEGDMYVITDNTGKWGISVENYNHLQNGDHLYRRSTCTKHGKKWGNIEKSLVWLSNPNEAHITEYNDEKTAIIDKEVKIDSDKRSNNPVWVKLDKSTKEKDSMTYNASQLELINYQT